MDQSGTDAAERPAFVYDPLKSPEYSIRLLKVSPNLEGDLISVHLRDHHISEPYQYRCLSYEWGPPSDDTHDILVNGNLLSVRANLHSFLRTARRRFPSIPLWIDAISIDQGHDEEKEKQVSRMADIYHMAFETIIWLGDFYGLNNALRKSNIPRRRGSREGFDDLVRIWNHTYWGRAWIGQEIVQSKNLSIHTIQEASTFATIASAWRKYSGNDSVALETPRPLGPMFWLDMWSDRHHLSRSQQLRRIWDFLCRTRQAKCAEKRDRIYSILSLIQGGKAFRVSYTESHVELFWRSGEYFGAWTRPHFVAILRRTLDVTIDELKICLGFQGSLELTIPLQSCITRLEDHRSSNKIKCASDICECFKKLPISYKSGDIMLCTRSQNDIVDHRLFESVHILFRSRTSDDLTLLVHDRSSRDGVFVQKLPRGALQLLTDNGWQGLNYWFNIDYYIEHNSLRGNWRLQIPAALVIELERCAGLFK